ncbi:MAG: hypothetical protein M5U14_17660 [Acidimicrobiia bacterium]|nr:hypothetical protein [Acidimicrobiia bacterium]
MELAEFTGALAQMSRSDLHRVAEAISSHLACAGDEVDAWHTTLAIDRALRVERRQRQAAWAAYAASQAVLAAADTAGIPRPDPEVTFVARAAAEVARGIVAGEAVALEVRGLLASWRPVVGVAA